MAILSGPCAGNWTSPGFGPAWMPPLRVSPGSGGYTLGGGLRCALHALGGQRHRVLAPGNRSRGTGRPGEFRAWPDAQMTHSGAAAVWGQVAAHAAGHGRRVSVADVCAV